MGWLVVGVSSFFCMSASVWLGQICGPLGGAVPARCRQKWSWPLPGYNSMVVVTWLDPPCKLTQSLESDAGEGLELTLHVGHVLEWLLFFYSLPLLLVLPKIVEELGLQLIPLLLLAGGVVVPVEGFEDVVQVLPLPCTLVIRDVPQRVSRGGLLSA